MVAQSVTAPKLLPHIIHAYKRGKLLNYGLAAQAVGQLASSARPIGQVCNLIDAATAWAGLPLLALHVVRSVSGTVNENAFRGNAFEEQHRTAILERSASHKFTEQDFNRIADGLRSFAGYSAHSAWATLFKQFTHEQVILQLAKGRVLQDDGLNDLGSDVADVQFANVKMFIRDQAVRQAVLNRAGGKCEYCGSKSFARPDGTPYLESHHIIALAKDGEDRLTNVIALCANDHRQAHFGADREALEKKMIAIVQAKTKAA